VAVGPERVLPPRTCLSMCRQAPQAASLSDDELEYAAGAASPPSASDGSAAGGSPAVQPGGGRERQKPQRPGAHAAAEGAEGAAEALSDGDGALSVLILFC
jgi:hypothetical protein